MSLHIHRFIDMIKAAEARGQRDLHINLRDAKDLHADITKLLLTLEQIRMQIHPATALTVEISGGDFKNS